MPNPHSPVDLTSLNTFHVSAFAQHFIQLNSIAEVQQNLTLIQQSPHRLILGGGSNLLFAGDYPGLVVYPQLFGIEVVEENLLSVVVKVGASQNWHEFALQATQQGWFGLENLALIPGTVGAAPVQNIGAYGVEVEQLIAQVECVDLNSGEQLVLSQADCLFAYRDSFFKQQTLGQYLITSVIFKLQKQPHLCLSYQPLADAFADLPAATPLDVLNKVCEIRLQKLPDPQVLPNAGSFFKNPIVSAQAYQQLKLEYPDLVAYSAGDGYKLAAGWLIEKAGFKGLREGNVGVHVHQALVLVNYAETQGIKIWQLAEKIQQTILQKFSVVLEPEVRLLGLPT